MHAHPFENDSASCQRSHPRRNLLWGLALILIGTGVLLDRFALLDLQQFLGPQTQWWHFLPLLISLGGLIRLLSAQSMRQVSKGLIRIVLGLWLYACLVPLWGLTFANSWPVLLVAFGVQMLVRGWQGRGRSHCAGLAP